MTTYADSSALVKLYVDEPGDALARQLDFLVVSDLARVELPSALWRKHRLGDIDAQQAADMVNAFESDCFSSDESSSFATIELDQAILEAAANATRSLGLRTLDAIQLASAIVARNADPDCTSFACFDVKLRDAAAASGFELIPQSID